MTTYVLMAGLPGTGKSTLAKVLAQELNGAVLSKDIVRAALFAGPLTDYTRVQDDLVFNMLLVGANYIANRGLTEFLFLDGRTFSRRTQIDETIEVTEAAGFRWRILLATCPQKLAEERLARDAANHPATNRTVAMYREIRARFEPIASPHLLIDTSEPLEACTERCLRYLRT